VFRKDERDWQWKFVLKKRTPKKTIQKEAVEEAGHD
jgi:hypothetical protein